jgi:hypothetical protein
VRTPLIHDGAMAFHLLSPTLMNNEEQALATEADETAARERTTDAYDSLEVEDDAEIELGDEDILFETDERD